MRIVLFLLISIWTSPAFAQSYPTPQSKTVNDYGDLIDAATEAALSKQLSDLRRETGVEMVIVTLDSVSAFAPGQSIENYATALFNAWSIGSASRNDGVLVLVADQDRAMRVELGRAINVPGMAWQNGLSMLSFCHRSRKARTQKG